MGCSFCISAFDLSVKSGLNNLLVGCVVYAAKIKFNESNFQSSLIKVGPPILSQLGLLAFFGSGLLTANSWACLEDIVIDSLDTIS